MFQLPCVLRYNLKNRFVNADIYTNIGTILVSLNPFDREVVKHLYTREMIDIHTAVPPGV